ncbi:hypothetical protein A2643_03560 [Candidatus Nomurabacteria bacterium RIFCSPHIGHO2_01_FULL_39_220]|uniref:Capsule synthesis protein CapA domain-containing protein n=1 Tax=Candidatus Nomurabacteria bacterium RIFCSPLOWO2_02_FULL_40_67 TaxID=1801787 RepID=A0A1F6Y2Q4_9BACT|nr:MAG: hypothetical protein UU01_C0016G0005 [Parcubacteria group bacterium GW2011_GWA2_40_37]KKS10854.1 MAG: hypothetical protein UU66_C0039G0004 [Parcubacteria group bacterium GW2011_GWB1_41_5]KKS71243.1 MAG: hypothetical protein UV43_C0042G0005 [Parcubacteria group bacterium GW2011_GWF2_42_7]OGI62869.1 MAG: hypothetical protein A2W12_02925 [Candidatus Nomurabacteria bacterium RBG_16_40_11]OGI69389.1 MAG: hypothetical protein A2643_03560 [Candidatus Nomurabacteria bacterium RIFCSPHIGHO2_01_FU
MLLNKKLISHVIWILLASILGISMSYLILLGGKYAYGAIYDTTTSQNIIVNTPLPPPEIKEVIKKVSQISIGFVGDIIPGISAPTNIFSDVKAHTELPDIMIGNFEGVATSNTYLKCKQSSKNCFSFNGNSNFLNLLSDASFDVLNVANNHFNDYGQIGQEETLKQIKETGIQASGIKDEIIYLKKNEIKIGIVGFSTYSYTSNMNNAEKVQELVNTADQNSDLVIVIFHGGGEGVKYGHTPDETEWYLGENRGDVRSFAHNAIDAGADLVLGSGPHVLRGIEWYNDKLIAYSLGNFASANRISTAESLKTSAMLEITLDKNGSLASGKITSFEIDGNGIPHPDLNNTAISIITDLSKSDFGEQEVILNSGGEIQID